MVLQTTPHHSAVPYTCNDNVAGGDAEENEWRFGNACGSTYIDLYGDVVWNLEKDFYSIFCRLIKLKLVL